ncbi:hypothetical protein OHA72_57985 [Dactylosporangium sp. NBC_01737]|uniref:hypothetical protein n=1 Tax=Dactylosporangium sp. NBC_01737 TaxID=2975959 RepID=UPI002E0D7549|nr:hypothetical protein OHA72_57985 [Dactylosporangium sp. NBC_01737]
MRRAGLGVLFYITMYGAPFLLIVALVRRTTVIWLPTRAAAEAFGATTDTLFISGMAAAVALPALGIALAKAADEPGWGRHFLGALIAAPLLFIVLAVVSARASTPLIGHVPGNHGLPAPVTVCAHECPGG